MSGCKPTGRERQPDARLRTKLGGTFSLVLSLSGGNALGAYQGGAYQAMREHDLESDWIAGASAGAINGAIICGNLAERRIQRLREFWGLSHGGHTPRSTIMLDEVRRTAASAWTLAMGRPDLFIPRNVYGPWWNPLGNREPASLYDATPLQGTLERLIDFDLLNQGIPRFSATAVDVETGEDVVFDTGSQRIGADHLRASAALLPAFAPVEIDGRLLCDAGISANLPLDSVLGATHDRPLLCVAIDLLPLRARRPSTLGDAVTRAQDLIFATQSRRAIAAWQALYDERTRHGGTASVTILHIAYADQMREVSGKAFDFSPESAAIRWQAGYAQVNRALDDVARDRIPIGRPGLSVYAPAEDVERLEQVRWELAPMLA